MLRTMIMVGLIGCAEHGASAPDAGADTLAADAAPDAAPGLACSLIASSLQATPGTCVFDVTGLDLAMDPGQPSPNAVVFGFGETTTTITPSSQDGRFRAPAMVFQFSAGPGVALARPESGRCTWRACATVE